MARILGGIGTSHTPTIGFALDARKHDDPVWAPIFKGYEPVQQWLADRKPDVLFFIYNDHVTSFFFDHYSHFALGIGDEYPVADEGGGARQLPPIKGHPALARQPLRHDPQRQRCAHQDARRPALGRVTSRETPEPVGLSARPRTA